ncbi:MAG: hypothetical protein NC914_00310, partial [Candidatus Omnitrophica bacterium]|nr:hypothetical protein [Candidatus Omnitrophota bacterium]
MAYNNGNMRKRIALVLFLFLAVTFFSFSLAADEQESAQLPAISQDKSEKIVTAIEIKGNKSISPNTIISKIKTKVGSPYLNNVVSDDLKRLYLLGYFSDIKIDTEEYKDGLKVIITVEEKPVIEKITFEGMYKFYYLKPEKLKEQIKSKEGQYLDYNNLKEDVAILRGMYEKKGFSDAKVDYRIETDPLKNKANVAFVVDEGKRVKVKRIYIEGNKTFKDGRLLKLLKTKTAWFFNAGVFKDEVFAEDLERIASFYKREGFTDVKVDYKTRRDPQKPFLYITLLIDEGQRYYTGTVTIEGNQAVAEKEIRDKLKMVIPGKVFSEEGMSEDE